jgi:ABC-type glycerol-3-phosphate transport system substrate-binding protein
VDAQVKAETGIAGIFQFLRSAQQVAPTILPDLVLVNTQQLWQLVDLGLVSALSEAEFAQQTGEETDSYPFAQNAITYRSQLYGIPYAADLVQGAFEPDAAMPATWANLLAAPQPFLFPGGNEEGYQPAHTLLQYVAAGGELLEDGSITSPEALRAYFDFLAEGRLRGAIPAEAADLSTFQAVWESYTGEPAGLAGIQTYQFRAGKEGVRPAFGPVPTRSGEPVTVAETWAFALLTQDPDQRALALELVQTLLDPSVQGAWSQFSGRLPSTRSALAAWSQAGAYTTFLDEQLSAALAIPNGRAFADFTRRLQTAQAAVLRGELTPEAASQNVATAP